MMSKQLALNYDYLAPDGSEIRELLSIKKGGMAHCILPTKVISKAIKHKTVEEIWYVISGTGKMWRKNGKNEVLTDLVAGTSLTIPIGTSFQFKNTCNGKLELIIVTIPPWPGEEEAISVEGHWC